MIYKNIKNKKGFTLVEMMVAIAVFSIVMVTSISALLNVIDANNKAKSIKVAINNISFALEGISKDMRMGTDYACGQDVEPSGDCLGGGNIIKYRSIRADEVLSGGLRKYAYYKISNGVISTCLEKGSISCNFNGPFTAITSNELVISTTTSKFYVLGVAGSNLPAGSGRTQPRMIMVISGTSGPQNKAKLQTSFDLQTSVSERVRI